MSIEELIWRYFIALIQVLCFHFICWLLRKKYYKDARVVTLNVDNKEEKGNEIEKKSVKNYNQVNDKKICDDEIYNNKDDIKREVLYIRPPSLRNMGATCYLNSAFQGISACDTFVKEITNLSKEESNLNVPKLQVFRELIDILNGCSKSDMEISRNSIFREWNKSGQQDSYEVLAYALNQVYNELRKHKETIGEIEKRNLDQWLTCILPMRYLIKYTIKCGCDMVTESPLQSDLALHVTLVKGLKTLDDLLDSYFEPDPIQDFVCDRKECKGEGTKRVARLIEPLPGTICVHLQRTFWNRFRMEKIDDKVIFTTKLIIKSKYIEGNCSKNKKDEEYDLVSVIVHSGSVFGGHYVCYKKVDGRWFLTNDSSVSEVKELSVLKCQAYILFYEQPYKEKTKL